ncbi:unnamed protein product [Urochloa humidicola]
MAARCSNPCGGGAAGGSLIPYVVAAGAAGEAPLVAAWRSPPRSRVRSRRSERRHHDEPVSSALPSRSQAPASYTGSPPQPQSKVRPLDAIHCWSRCPDLDWMHHGEETSNHLPLFLSPCTRASKD